MPGSLSGGAGSAVALRENEGGGFFVKLYDVPATTRNRNTKIAILRISKSRTGGCGDAGVQQEPRIAGTDQPTVRAGC